MEKKKVNVPRDRQKVTGSSIEGEDMYTGGMELYIHTCNVLCARIKK